MWVKHKSECISTYSSPMAYTHYFEWNKPFKLYETQFWPVNKCSLGAKGEKLTLFIGCGKDW
jgi:hypothetical protein